MGRKKESGKEGERRTEVGKRWAIPAPLPGSLPALCCLLASEFLSLGFCSMKRYLRIRLLCFR
jgi:hypothetical protein